MSGGLLSSGLLSLIYQRNPSLLNHNKNLLVIQNVFENQCKEALNLFVQGLNEIDHQYANNSISFQERQTAIQRITAKRIQQEQEAFQSFNFARDSLNKNYF